MDETEKPKLMGQEIQCDEARIRAHFGDMGRALRKGQGGRTFNLNCDPISENRIIERAFSVGPCVMAEAVAIIEEGLAAL